MKTWQKGLIQTGIGVAVFGGIIAAVIVTTHGKQQAFVTQAQQQVASLLRDPASARFTQVRKERNPLDGDVLCGYVHGKNGFGGYGDPLWFVATASEAEIAEWPASWTPPQGLPCGTTDMLVAGSDYAIDRLEHATP